MPNNIVERATHYTLRHDKVQSQVLPPIRKNIGTNKQLQALKNFERLQSVLHCMLFRRFGMSYGPAIMVWIVVGMVSVYGQAKKPSIVFDSITKDAGKVTQGETVKQVFTFTNKGSGTLEIMNVQPT
jgi:hypothetical protein